MAKGLNKVILIGNLGGEVELRYTSSGIAVANFSIATTDSWKDADGNKQEKTEWHNITAWKKLAEICGQYLHKGSRVYVEGSIGQQTWDKDGVKQYKTIITIQSMLMLDTKKEGAPVQEEPSTPIVDNSGLPF
jgi:single-strand DNA-binding protein